MTEQDIIKGIEEYLKKKYEGVIPAEFSLIMEVIKNTLHRYMEIKQEIDKNGIISKTTNARSTLLPYEEHLALVLIRACKSLGISPLDSAKLLKVEKAVDNTEESTEDFIEALTK